MRLPFRLVLVLVLLCVGGFFAYRLVFAERSAEVEIPAGLTRLEVAEQIGSPLWWAERTQSDFASVWAQMQWVAWNGPLIELFAERFDLSSEEREALATHSITYITPELDFMASVYMPGTYMVESSLSEAQIAGMLIDRVNEVAKGDIKGYLNEHIASEAAQRVVIALRSERELLPDIVPLPPQDLKLEVGTSTTLLRFSTVYYNQGKGPLELRADPKTKGIRSDIERDVFQRIYAKDGSYRDKVAGTFLWHQEHLHYHFDDFVNYDLEAVSAPGHPDLSGSRVKSTFCIRDVSRVKIEVENRPKDAAYQICGKELQGISVGWGDTYFYSYPDQFLNITDLSSGTYRLSFHANPSRRFDELSFDNNKSYIVFTIDMKKGTFEITEEFPKNAPEVEHVYPEQDCPVCVL